MIAGSQLRAGTLLQADFNSATPWPALAAYRIVSAGAVAASAVVAPVGTIDTAGSVTPTGAVLLSVDSSAALGAWSAGAGSGLLAVANTEPDAARLTLAFTLSVSLARPVIVRVESFDATGARTGGLATIVYPAAADFYQRYAIDLGTMTASGAGAFQPLAPQFQFSFEIGSAVGGDSWPSAAGHEVRLDNFHFASPAYYVSAAGNDSANNGRTVATALRTPQRALDLAQPGDVILVMDGTYSGGLSSAASFRRAGAPAGWISLKNYPGHQPLLTSTGWNIVSITAGSAGAPSSLELAYLEVLGLHIRGEGDVAKQKYPDAMNQADSRTNSNGIAIDGRYMKNVPHHIRFADNLVEYCPGQGLGALEADWITIENNVSRYNCWTTIYGTSGISTLGASNFDATVGNYKMLIRNNTCHRNETFEKWAALNRYSDGNGIIIDVNQKTSTNPTGSFLGRTLVQNNLCYDNGGSGIHTVTASRVDIINNTAYLNSASVNLEYSQIFTYGSSDVRITNNILVAPIANLAAGERPEPVNQLGGVNTGVFFSNNLYFGGNLAPSLGPGDLIADPRFVSASRDPAVADFRLKDNSVAIDSGLAVAYAPRRDLAGSLRPQGAAPDRGAFESAAFVAPAANPLARLVNLSVRTALGEGDTLIAGFATAGGAKPLLLRAVGPGLAAFLDGALADPRIAFYNSAGEKIDENDNWPGALAPLFSSVGAFPLASGSRDAALMHLIDGPHTAQISGTGAGIVLLEAYDTQPTTTARLANLSARHRLGAGSSALTAGFVLQGAGAKGVLVRGIGPGLTALGVPGALAAARLEIFSGAVKIADNDGWGPALAPTFASVGAFALAPRSADAALALALAPGAYTIQLSAADRRVGDGLIEIYELP
jgi:hypothetical protein